MNTELNFPRRLLAGLTALALLLMLALPVWQKERRLRSCRSPSTVWKTFCRWSPIAVSIPGVRTARWT